MARSKQENLPGVNIQAPWADLILNGQKTIETRFYPLPKHLVGKEMIIIETPGAKVTFKRRAVGIIIFGESFLYKNPRHFYRDSSKHQVYRTSDFSWEKGNGKPKWGWPILSVKRIEANLPGTFRAGIIFSREVPIQIQVEL